MSDITIPPRFETVYRIVSNPRFLQRQGLGNEVPFFVEPYRPEKEFAVVDQIISLHRRLAIEGIPSILLPMYDVVLDTLKRSWPLERVFDLEKRLPKKNGRRTFLEEMKKFTDPGKDKALQREILTRLESVPDHRLVLMYQLGTVYPYLRTHTLLNNLHSVITAVPLVVFFPGDYVSSDRDGYYFSLFGRFHSDYYRAFDLTSAPERIGIDAHAE